MIKRGKCLSKQFDRKVKKKKKLTLFNGMFWNKYFVTDYETNN